MTVPLFGRLNPLGSRNSFQRELIISMSSVLIGAACASAVLVTLLTYDRTASLARHQAEQFVASTAPDTSYSLLIAREDQRAATATLHTLTQRPDVQYAQLSDEIGRPLASQGQSNLALNATNLQGLRARSVRSAFAAGHWHVQAPVFVQSSVEFDAPARPALVGYLYVVVSPAQFWSLYESIVVAIITGALVALLMGLVWILVRSRRLTQPVIELTQSMEVASVDVQLRARGNGPAEIERMASAFNQLMQRLENHQASLEQTVEAKTSELRAANTELLTAIGNATQAERFKGAILAAVSHEMKTPLHSIEASLLEALHELEFVQDSGAGAVLREHLSIALGQKERLVVLINQIMDHARAKAGRHSVQLSVLHAEDLLQELQRLFEAIAKQHRNVLAIRREGLSSFVTDAEKLKTIAVNLLSNACKYTRGGTISAVICVTDVTLTLVVEDNGCGIDSQCLNAVWEEFRQGDMGENRATGGTGLGLAVTKDFVELLGGTAKLMSSKGKGTRVTVVIPTHVPLRTMELQKETTDAALV